MATTTVQRADLFAVVEYGGYGRAVKISPALSYDWNEMFGITYTGDKDVPCSVSVSWDTYVSTELYDTENKKSIKTRLVDTANKTVILLDPMTVDRENQGCTHYRRDGADFVLKLH